MSLRIGSSSQPMTGHVNFVCGDEGLKAWRRRLGIPSLFRLIGVISLRKRSEPDIVLSPHLSMSVRLLTKPFNGRPLKALAASVQQWKCVIHSAYADVFDSSPFHAPCIFNRYQCVRQ